MKKRKKIIMIDIISIICAVLLSITALFYFTDPFERFHNYEIPASPDDIVLCYYQNDPCWDTEFYMITNDGTVKKSRGEWLFIGKNSYEKINQNETKGIKIEPLTDEQLHILTKMNADNCRSFNIPSVSTEQFHPMKSYYIVQKEDGQFVLKTIWRTDYYYCIMGDKCGEYKCRSKYTNDICRYIDYAVDEARKAGL